MLHRVPLLLTLVIAMLPGCSGPTRTPVTSAPAPVPAPTTPPPCPGAPAGADVVSRLALGESIEDPEASPWRLADGGLALGPLLPGVAADHDVWAVIAVEAVANDRLELAALISRKGSGAVYDSGTTYRPVSLAVLTCQDGAGWVAAAPAVALDEVVSAHLIGADPVVLPGGVTATAVRVRRYGGLVDEEFTEYAYLIGAPQAGYPVEPAGAAVGSLGIVASTAQLVRDVDEAGDLVSYGYASYRASGWLPAGDRQLYVGLRVSHGEGLPATAVEVAALGAVGPGGVVAYGLTEDVERAWVLLGTGPRPAACDGGAIRCLPGGESLPPFGTLPFAWAAGTWPTVEAATAAAEQLGVTGTWALIGDPYDGDAEPPEDEDGEYPRIKGPDGKPATGEVPLLPPAD